MATRNAKWQPNARVAAKRQHAQDEP